jgi:lysophospholipase L1-like esterase
VRTSRLARVGLFVAINVVAVGLAYFGGIYFSYLVVPQAKPYAYRIKIWQRDGYYKVEPGRYENQKYGVVYTINSRGFRSPEFAPEKGAGFRIVAMGESSTMGLESGDGDTWPSQLQRLLVGGRRPVEVINAGIGASSSPHQLAMLRAEILRYRPDLIVYYAGRNDHYIVNVERYPGPQIWDPRMSFFRHWFIFKRVQARLVLLKTFGVDVEDKLPYWSNARWARGYRANLRAMLGAAKAAGIPVLIVSQLLDYPPEVLDALLRHEGTASFARRLSLRDEFWHVYLRQRDLLGIQAAVAREFENVRMIDLHRALAEGRKSGPKLFFDDVHLTPAGNALVARAIAADVREHDRPLCVAHRDGPAGDGRR